VRLSEDLQILKRAFAGFQRFAQSVAVLLSALEQLQGVVAVAGLHQQPLQDEVLLRLAAVLIATGLAAACRVDSHNLAISRNLVER